MSAGSYLPGTQNLSPETCYRKQSTHHPQKHLSTICISLTSTEGCSKPIYTKTHSVLYLDLPLLKEILTSILQARDLMIIKIPLL